MDITLIAQSDTKYNKDLDKEVISDTGITELSDCALVLLHKSGLRPLYVVKNGETKLHLQPDNCLEKPDVILYADDEGSFQSASVISEQLKNNDCFVKMIPAKMPQQKNSKIFKNVALSRIKSLEENGYQHVVIITRKEDLDSIVYCISQQEVKPKQNLPIYSFSGGKPIKDSNLTSSGLYMTRDILDDMLIYRIKNEKDQRLSKFSKSSHPLEVEVIKRKLNLTK